MRVALAVGLTLSTVLLGLQACVGPDAPVTPEAKNDASLPILHDSGVPMDAGDASDAAESSVQGDTGTSLPSCVGLSSICGPKEDEDCCASPAVQGGTYFRGFIEGTDGGTASKDYKAKISDFRLDRFEVTVGRFRRFLNAYPASKPAPGSGQNPNAPDDEGWQAEWNANLAPDAEILIARLACDDSPTWKTKATDAADRMPLNCVDWYTAFAFCAWDGGRLPTEAEWNYVAAAGTTQWPYPWGTEMDSTRVLIGDSNFIKSVGSYSPAGDSRWKQADIIGSVWEWTVDEFTAYSSPCSDCSVTPKKVDLNTSRRMDRGGAWTTAGMMSLATSAYRYHELATHRNHGVGFRCAR